MVILKVEKKSEFNNIINDQFDEKKIIKTDITNREEDSQRKEFQDKNSLEKTNLLHQKKIKSFKDTSNARRKSGNRFKTDVGDKMGQF